MKIFNIVTIASLVAGFTITTTAFAISNKTNADVNIEMTEKE